MLKRLISFLVSLSMVISVLPQTFAAESLTEPTEDFAETVAMEATTEFTEETNASAEAVTEPSGEIITFAEGVTEPSEEIITSAEGVTEPSEEIIASVEAVTEPSEETIEITALVRKTSNETIVSAEVVTGSADETPALISSGSCGEKANWSLDSEGVFTVSGEGDMAEYGFDWDLYYEPMTPWYKYRSSIKKVVIEDGITSICGYAFYNCQNMTEVIIGDDVIAVGDMAFSNSNYVTKLTVGKNVRSFSTVGSGVFNGWVHLEEIHISDLAGWCAISGNRPCGWDYYDVKTYIYLNGIKLTDVELPETVTEIIGNAFSGYSGITSVTIPDSVVSIDGTAFSGPDMEAIYYQGDVTQWVSMERTTYVHSSAVQLYIDGSLVENVVIPAGVTEVGDYAFYGCQTLKSVQLPDSIVRIGKYAFANTTVLNNISVGSGLEQIDSHAFTGCAGITALSLGRNLSSIGDHAFSGCTTLTQLEIPGSVSSMGEYGFENCTALKNISISAALNQIPEGLFFGCIALESIELPDSVTVLYKSAFEGCTGLETVTMQEVTQIGNRAFYGCTALSSCTFPASLVSVGDYAFYGCEELTAFAVQSELESIGSQAFFGCTSLTELTLSDTVSTIGEKAFQNCTALKTVMLAAGLDTLPAYVFDGCSAIESLTIPGNIQNIAEYAFRNATSLTQITFEGDAPTIASTAFTSVSATCLYPSGNTTYTAAVTTSDYGGNLIWTYEGEMITDQCGDDITWELTDDGCLVLTGTGAMYDYSHAELIYAPWYENRSNITEIQIGAGITQIGNDAFYSCSAAESVSIPDTVTAIGSYAFYCFGAKSVELPEQLAVIGDNAFRGAELTSIVIPDTATQIGAHAFGATMLTSVVLPQNMTHIPEGMFSGSNELVNVTIPDSLKSIGNSAFSGCYSLKSMVLPEGLESIGDAAFYGCGGHDYYSHSFTSITLPSTLKTIGKQAFWYCQSLSSVTIPNGVTVVPEMLFGNCYGLRTVVLPIGVTSIGEDAFLGCKSLSSITFQWSAPQIDSNAFSSQVKANCYYPSNNEEWTADKRQNYGGQLTWIGQEMEKPGVIPVPGEGEETDDPNGDNTDDNNTGGGGNNGGNNGNDNTGDNGDNNTGGGNSGSGSEEVPDCTDGHQFGEWEIFAAPTCTVAGEKRRYCSKCTVVEHESINPPGHTEVTDGAVEPTCTEDGLTEGKHCSVCGEIITAQEVVPAVHNVVDGICVICGVYGTCGEGLTWFFDEESGTLTISGEGIMNDYSFDGAPWQTHATSIYKIVVEENVTTIGDGAFCGLNKASDIHIASTVEAIGYYAFSGCGMVSIELPESLTVVEEGAFSGCESLADITIPSGVTALPDAVFSYCYALTAVNLPETINSIGQWAFSDSGLASITLPGSVKEIQKLAFASCSNLTDIQLSEGLTGIGENAFNGCSALTEIWIPASVVSITENPFKGCRQLKRIEVADESTSFSADTEGVLFNKGMTNLICCPMGYEGENGAYNIPASVITIGTNAFDDCWRLTSVTIPVGVTAIGKHAFRHSYNIAELVIPETVSVIGECAFQECSGMNTIKFAGNAPSIGEDAFFDVEATAYYPSENTTWTSKVMQNYGGTLDWVVYDAHVHEFVDNQCECGAVCGTCGANATWILDDGILTISGHGPMNDFNNYSGKPWYTSEDRITSVIINEGITYIGSYAFFDCGILQSVALPDTLQKIGDSAFRRCVKLETVNIPNGLSAFGTDAFSESDGNPRSFRVAEDNPYLMSDDAGVIYNKDVTKLLICPPGLSGPYIIPDGVTEIGAYAFYECHDITEVTLPDTLKIIGDYAFYWCFGPEEMMLPEGVTKIGKKAFGSSDIVKLSIPSTLVSVGEEAFDYCLELEELYISDLDAWCDITFADSSSNPMSRADRIYLNGELLTEIHVPEGITTLKPYAFYGSPVEKLSLPDSITTIRERAFCSNDQLRELIIPASVTSLGYYALAYCSNLTSVYFMGNAPSFDYIFYSTGTAAYYPAGNSTWTEDIRQNYGGSIVWIPYPSDDPVTGTCGTSAYWSFDEVSGTLTISGTGAMTDFKSPTGWYTGVTPWYGLRHKVTSVVIEEGITSIGNYAFYNFTVLENIDVPDSVNDVGEYVFYNCEALTGSLILPEGLTTVGAYAFYNCRNLTGGIAIPEGVTSVGYYAFANCSGLNGTITIPDSVTSIGFYAFGGCSGLHGNLVLPDSLTSMDYEAFKNCSGLESVTIGAGLTTIPESAFYNCSNLKGTLVIPDGIETIGLGAFYNAQKIDSVVVGTGVTLIGDGRYWGETLTSSFQDCFDVQEVTFVGNTPPEVNGDFLSLSSLETVWVPKATLAAYTAALENKLPEGVVIKEKSNDAVRGTCGENLTWTFADGQLVISGAGDMYEYKSASDVPWYSYKDQIVTVIFEPGITGIGKYAFYGYTNIVGEIIIPAGVTCIEDYAFTGCTGLTGTLRMPDSVETIGWQAFAGCAELTDLELGENLQILEYMAFNGCSGLKNELVIPDNVQSIGAYAFMDCSGLASLKLGNSVKTVGAYAFYQCSGLTCELVFPDSMEAIGYGAFSGCTGLSGKLIFPDNVTTIGYYAFNNIEGITEIVFGNKVESIGWSGYTQDTHSPFYGCNKVEEVTFMGTNVPTMYANIFQSLVELTTVWVLREAYDAYVMAYGSLLPEGVEIKCIEDSSSGDGSCNLPTHNYTAKITKPTCTEKGYTTYTCECGDSYVDTYVEATGHSFGDWYETVTATTETEGEERRDCAACDAYETRVIEKLPAEDDADETIGGTCGDNLTWEFDEETSTLTISGTGEMYDFADAGSPWYALNGKITHVVIHEDATSIGNYAFISCGIEDILIPDSVTRIGECAFASSKIKSITIPDGVTEIEEYTFSMSALTSIVLPEQLKVIGENAFAETELTAITLPNSLEKIGAEAFWGTKLTTVTIPQNVSVIGTGTFAWCEALVSFSVAENNINFAAQEDVLFDKNSTTLIQYPAKKAQETYAVPEGTFAIGAYAFSGAKALQGITLPDSITAFMSCAFIGCSGLTEIEIPQNVESFASGVFQNCNGLTTVTFTGSAPTFAGNWITRDISLTAYYPRGNATWTESVMKDYGGTITWVEAGAHANRVVINPADLNGQASVWIDGEEYTVQTDGNIRYVDLSGHDAKTMTIYTYHADDATDIHTQYPVGMKVWMLENENGIYTATRAEELDNILQYSGTSIRVTGKQGIRMITSIDRNKKKSLISDGLAGYTLREYGTVVAWASQMEGGKPLVLGEPYTKSNYAYKKGIADPVFADNGGLVQYTNVLVGFSLDQCKNDLAMRPYIILTDAEGNDITLYGGIVQRSIGYIAVQNAYTFNSTTQASAYQYVWNIITHVYGDDYIPEAA